MLPRASRAVLITDAEPSQEEQLRSRERRYLAMMALRVLSLGLAAVLVSIQPPLLWLWLLLCVGGMTIVPWVAVVLANDRPPKERYRWRRRRSAKAGDQRGSGNLVVRAHGHLPHWGYDHDADDDAGHRHHS